MGQLRVICNGSRSLMVLYLNISNALYEYQSHLNLFQNNLSCFYRKGLVILYQHKQITLKLLINKFIFSWLSFTWTRRRGLGSNSSLNSYKKSNTDQEIGFKIEPLPSQLELYVHLFNQFRRELQDWTYAVSSSGFVGWRGSNFQPVYSRPEWPTSIENMSMAKNDGEVQ